MRRNIDVLTGLRNRTYIKRILSKYILEKKNICTALIDIDYFTNINQKIGCKNGDFILTKLARLCSIGDITGRYGSDEFIIVFINRDTNEIIEQLEKLKYDVKHSKVLSAPSYGPLRLTLSIGVADTGQSLNTPFLLLKATETALFTAKKNGRSRIEYYPGGPFVFLRDTGVCATVAGRCLKGSNRLNTLAYFAPISEPYGVEGDRNDDLLFVDRSNHQIKRIHLKKVSIVAGCGEPGYSGDKADAVEAKLCKPSGVCVDKQGNIYIADTGNHCIRKIKDGIIYTIAGNGKAGYSGDGCKAIFAKLSRPGGIVTDNMGNLYTNDYGNNVIRKIDVNGFISTVAGNSEYGYSGDGGMAINASMDRIYGLCVNDTGTMLYIADYGNHCVRQVDTQKGIITTLCGTGKAGYTGDGGPGTDACLNGPFWLALWKSKLFIADSHNHCIREVDLNTGVIDTVVGNGEPGYIDHLSDIAKARFNTPAGMTVIKNHLYIADYGNNAIRRVML